ncbi:MAG: hypothetical protein MJZ02_06475 [Paludibacteraceae bacterium]|nr:hypothetical protein [Paludibacteraceae bacterium]
MWKDFLYYTKTERRGIAVLTVLIILLALIRFALPHLQSGSTNKALSKTEIERLHQLEEQMSKLTENRPLKGKIDPLQLDSSGFVKVGFTATEAQELIRLKRSNNRENFYFKFMDYAIRKNPEWADHIADYRE